MSRRIFYDGLNLSLEHGTGIATYTRMLARIARELGYEVGAVYSSPHRPAKNPLLREIGFFDPREARPVPFRKRCGTSSRTSRGCRSGSSRAGRPERSRHRRPVPAAG